ncbi:MAG: alpha/beta hydrolase [Sedimentibacter sp.]|uniref:alpha/beta hydrolase n=1 Tax=Sedimentibacter sp. TaxID=1960295 RepID=UPI0031591D72
MKKYVNIEGVPALIQGDESDKVLIAVHGLMSNKEDTVINIATANAIKKGYQTVSIDLPEHGERKDGKSLVPWVCAEEIQKVYQYIQNGKKEISLFACSIGAYMSMLALKDIKITKSCFLSPIVNMTYLIQGMMNGFSITEDMLEQQKYIPLPIGQTLNWNYYMYTKEHPVYWNHDAFILWGNKDDMMPESEIDLFSYRSQAAVEKVDSEHYFHTEEQLKLLQNWIERVL